MSRALAKWVIPAVMLGLFAALALSGSVESSATWDETHYLGLGVYLLKNLRWDVPSALLHPPLSYYIHSIPLLFLQVDLGCFEKGKAGDVMSGVRRGQCLMRKSGPSGDALLFWARLPTVCFGVLLGAFVYRWSLSLYGALGALVCLFLYCFSPNILAHTALITPDIPLTTFGFISAYYFWRNRQKPSMRNIALCGVFLGLALLSKYSALLWVIIFILLSLLAVVLEAKASRLLPCSDRRKGPIYALGAVVAIAILVVITGYGFQGSLYVAGLEAQRGIAGYNPPAFLNGIVDKGGGWWYYHIAAFVLKETVPALLCLMGTLFLWRWIRLPRWFDGLCLLIPALSFFLAFSFAVKVNLGLRYVLPAFPFLIVFSGGLAVACVKKGVLRGLLLLPLLFWQAYECISIHPHYLAYFNQIGGGPAKGYLHLVDSNLDWGQDLKKLKAYLDKKKIDRVKLSYFGTADPGQYGIRYDPLPSFVLPNPPSASLSLKKGDIVAVSATNLYPLYVDLGKLGEHLRSISPKDHVGHSILVYEINQPFQ